MTLRSVFQQGSDCVVDDANNIFEIFLAISNAFVEEGTLDIVLLEESRGMHRCALTTSFSVYLSDVVALEPMYRRCAPLGIQASPALLWIEGEADHVRVSVVLLHMFTKSVELRDLARAVFRRSAETVKAKTGRVSEDPRGAVAGHQLQIIRGSHAHHANALFAYFIL